MSDINYDLHGAEMNHSSCCQFLWRKPWKTVTWKTEK